jgi:hypothetical protein
LWIIVVLFEPIRHLLTVVVVSLRSSFLVSSQKRTT